MGSEKKKKRRHSDVEEAASNHVDAEKAERKRLKKARRESITNVEKDAVAEVQADIPTLVSPIATPMAGRKLTKKIFKLISHAAKGKALRRGIKEAVLAMRKGDTGIVVMAGDVFPVEVISHVPLLCEEANIPYCFVSRKTDLGAAGLTKRPTSIVLVSQKKAEGDVKDELNSVRKEVAEIQNLF